MKQKHEKLKNYKFVYMVYHKIQAEITNLTHDDSLMLTWQLPLFNDNFP